MPVAVQLHATSKPWDMIGNEKCIRVCRYTLEEAMCTLPYGWCAESVSHFHENPGGSDQRLTQVLRYSDGGSMKTVCRVQQSDIVESISEHFDHDNGFPWA